MDRETYSALIDTEWSCFLARCWERNEFPTDEAWRANLRREAYVYLHFAHKLMCHAIDGEESVERHNQASDAIVAYVNDSPLRMSPFPWLPEETWNAYMNGDGSFGDDEFDAAVRARADQLQVMRYLDYLATPEWAEQRRWALDRADGRCQTCGRGKRLHVHHRTYGGRGDESVTDLVVLCEDCHLAVHTSGGSHRPAGIQPV